MKSQWIRRKGTANFSRPSLIFALKWEKYLHIGLYVAPLDRASVFRIGAGRKIGKRMRERRGEWKIIVLKLEARRSTARSHCHSNDLYARLKLDRPGIYRGPSSRAERAMRPSSFSDPPLFGATTETRWTDAAVGVSTMLKQDGEAPIRQEKKKEREKTAHGGMKCARRGEKLCGPYADPKHRCDV